MKRVKPTAFFAVPRVWEKMAEKLKEVGAKNTGLKKKVADLAKSAATKHHTLVREGKRDPLKPSWDYILAKKLVFAKVHEALGLDEVAKRTNITASTAAPLSVETFNYFQSLDIVLTEFYGSTEASGPHTSNMAGMMSHFFCEKNVTFYPNLRVTLPSRFCWKRYLGCLPQNIESRS